MLIRAEHIVSTCRQISRTILLECPGRNLSVGARESFLFTRSRKPLRTSIFLRRKTEREKKKYIYIYM